MNATNAAKQALDLPVLCQSIGEGSPMPMAVVDGLSHKIRYVNPAFCRLLGSSAEKLIGSPFCGSVLEGQECLALLDRVYRTGQAETHLGEEKFPSHPFYWSYVMWPLLGPDRAPVGVIVQVTESTPVHRQTTAMNQALMIGSVRQHELTEAANVQLRAELSRREQAEEVLRQANADLQQFAFAASHDLREPLRMITTYSQLLIKRHGSELDKEGAVFLRYIAESAERMGGLLADLLSYTQAGIDDDTSAESVDLNAVCDDAIKNLQAGVAESGAVITRGPLPEVYGHEAHFIQLFQNLIGNAIKYRGAQPLVVHVSAEKIDGEWRFAVADNGMGIDPKYHRQIFGVFKRLHGVSIPGTGIGLAICQRVVERYGGRIWVESELNHGARFCFTLPVVAPDSTQSFGTYSR
jgi:PAS domain S-box-containing protein